MTTDDGRRQSPVCAMNGAVMEGRTASLLDPTMSHARVTTHRSEDAPLFRRFAYVR
jgi:hypothetical protein